MRLAFTGAMEAQASAAMAGHINGVDSEKRKRTRGAKPKYHFVTAEEAIAHRCKSNCPMILHLFILNWHPWR